MEGFTTLWWRRIFAGLCRRFATIRVQTSQPRPAVSSQIPRSRAIAPKRSRRESLESPASETVGAGAIPGSTKRVPQFPQAWAPGARGNLQDGQLVAAVWAGSKVTVVRIHHGCGVLRTLGCPLNHPYMAKRNRSDDIHPHNQLDRASGPAICKSMNVRAR